MYAIFKKELETYYTSFFTYFYYALFFFVIGLFFILNCLSTYSTQFGYFVLSRGFLVIVLIIPFCTMRLFAQERKSRTDQMLFTAPVSTFSILMGKYLATVVCILVPVILSAVYPVFIAMQGEMSLRFLSGTYIAVFFVTLVLLSIGMFLSSLTANVVLSAVATFGVYVIILLARVLESIISSEGLFSLIHDMSIYNKYYDMISGIIRSGDVIYLLSLVICLFFLTWLNLERRRIGLKRTVIGMVLVAAVGLLVSGAAFRHTRVYDFTAEQLLTLSNETKKTVKEVEKVTDIYYMGEQSRANATYQELLNEYHKLNSNIKIHYKNAGEDSAFRSQYLSNLSAVNESSILVVTGEKYIYLDSSDFISTVQTSKYSYKNMLEIENQITSAVYYTNAGSAEKLYMISGHGEADLNSDFYNLMLLNRFEIENLNLSNELFSLEAVFPEDCKAVIINAPQNDYSEEEIKALEEYMSDGGKLFVALDPLNEDVERLLAFLKKYGLEVVSGVVMEEDSGYAYDTPYYIVPEMQDTEFTKTLIKNNMQVLTMTSKGILKKGNAKGYTSTDVLTTSAKSFSKISDFDNATSKSEGDISGPFSVASCAEHEKEGTLFLLTSNIFFNEKADADSAGANRRFFLEVMNYLTENDIGIMVEGKEIGNQKALYPNNLQLLFKITALVILPLLIIIAGAVVMLVRYRNVNFSLMKKKREQNENQEQ